MLLSQGLEFLETATQEKHLFLPCVSTTMNLFSVFNVPFVDTCNNYFLKGGILWK